MHASCTDARCASNLHRTVLPPGNFVQDDRYLYVRDSLQSPFGARHSRIEKWYQDNPSNPASFHRDVISRIQTVHNAILRAVATEAQADLDPADVTIQLVDPNTTRIFHRGTEIRGDLALRPGEGEFITSAAKTVHTAMLYLLNHLRAERTASSGTLVPGYVASAPPLPPHTTPVSTNSNSSPPHTTPVSTSSNGFGSPVIPQFNPQFPPPDDTTHQPLSPSHTTPLSTNGNGSLPPGISPFNPQFPPQDDSGTTHQPLSPSHRGSPPSSGFRGTTLTASRSSKPVSFHSHDPLQEGVADQLDRVASGWTFNLDDWPKKISFREFRNGQHPAVQQAFLKLVQNPGCQDDDARTVREMLDRWYDAAFPWYADNNQVNDGAYQRFLQKHKRKDDADSQSLYVQYHALQLWFRQLQLQGLSGGLLQKEILHNKTNFNYV
jgi:hypothetical protein